VARVLRNLLENAIRHTPSDGTVWVSTGVAQDQVFVSVADQCGGISPDELGRVFDPSFRGETARTPRSDGGAGLGLAIARGIVEAHHGEIGVQNEGGGCRFTVRLPISAISTN
jgi:signal transduction histidine kinase